MEAMAATLDTFVCLIKSLHARIIKMSQITFTVLFVLFSSFFFSYADLLDELPAPSNFQAHKQ